MSEVATTRLLADMPGVIPTLAIWYKAEWADWFANTSLDEIEADFHTVATRDKLPFAAVALDKDMQPLGVCSVRSAEVASRRGAHRTRRATRAPGL